MKGKIIVLSFIALFSLASSAFVSCPAEAKNGIIITFDANMTGAKHGGKK